MRNLKVMMSYNGASYHGYQIQNNANSIQQTVEDAIKTLIGEKITINGCSRTDTGVHAKGFVFNFKTENSIPCSGFTKGMNALLPTDIAILSCEEVDDSFHARFDSKGKEYLYRINCSDVRDVFAENLALHYPYKLDVDKMREAAKLMCGIHDFAAFCKSEAKEHLATTVRTVYSIDVKEKGNYVEVYVSGDGFLHNMVRIIVGTLIYISEGKRTERDIINALETGDRELAGKTVAPGGLYLNKVFY
ncbi:MAG: tRNA pseudouridine(38-40) synthase TruA [Ruminococcaceae bacterium]|nr:tRNA pseudouridine(38-40) synthase TruA [Oscillospiraceae bacterium]